MARIISKKSHKSLEYWRQKRWFQENPPSQEEIEAVRRAWEETTMPGAVTYTSKEVMEYLNSRYDLRLGRKYWQ